MCISCEVTADGKEFEPGQTCDCHVTDTGHDDAGPSCCYERGTAEWFCEACAHGTAAWGWTHKGQTPPDGGGGGTPVTTPPVARTTSPAPSSPVTPSPSPYV